MFKGTFTALVTPFRNEDVDLAALEKLIEAQIAAGITGLVAIGTTGESPTLSHDERESVIRKCVEIARGRCTVLAGTGSYSTREAIEATQRAESLGANAALVVAPYYNKPSQEGLFRHFKAIADATKLPVVLYNIPGRCGVDIGPDTVVRLAETCKNIVSIKEAGGSVERVSELRSRLAHVAPRNLTALSSQVENREFTILSGDDSLTLPFMSAGAVGVVSVASNAFPSQVCALVNAFQSGDAKSAEQAHRKMFRLFKDLFIEPNPVPVKTVLAWRGVMSGEVRLPLCEMTEANQARLRKTLEAFEKSK